LYELKIHNLNNILTDLNFHKQEELNKKLLIILNKYWNLVNARVSSSVNIILFPYRYTRGGYANDEGWKKTEIKTLYIQVNNNLKPGLLFFYQYEKNFYLSDIIYKMEQLENTFKQAISYSLVQNPILESVNSTVIYDKSPSYIGQPDKELIDYCVETRIPWSLSIIINTLFVKVNTLSGENYLLNIIGVSAKYHFDPIFIINELERLKIITQFQNISLILNIYKDSPVSDNSIIIFRRRPEINEKIDKDFIHEFMNNGKAISITLIK